MSPPAYGNPAVMVEEVLQTHGGDDSMEVEMAPADDIPTAADMGYEEHQPTMRRGSMSHDEQKERRASIKAIMADDNMSPMAKRRSIQHLMDGRRNSMGAGDARRGSMTGGSSVASSVASRNSSCGTPELSDPELVDSAMDCQYLCPDLVPTETSNPSGENDVYGISNEHTKRAEETRPPCGHYARKCTLIAPCCGAAFGCRICHDECPILPPKFNNGGRRYHRSASLPSSFTSMENSTPEDTHHTIDRFAVREVICRECYTRQSSKTNNCVRCGVQFGEYHCGVCNLWMGNDEKPYHCNECGFCRVGGAENFRHCKECGMCIDKSLYDEHNCRTGKYKSNCPVCQEYLFSSRSASHEMPCGHAIHWDCFRQLAAHDSRCPVCKKTAETRDRMLPTWNAMAAGVALQPVPPELARVVNITCNDCEQSEENRAWHFLGVQCNNCSSFNTVVDEMILSGEEAHEFLELRRQAAQIHRDGEQRNPRRRVNRRRSAF